MALSLGYAKVVNFNSIALPLNDNNMEINGAEIEDTNQVTSGGDRTRLVGLTDWMLDGNGHIGAVAGYNTTIKKGGTSTATTGEAVTNVSGKIYQVTDTAKRVIDETVTGESTLAYITVYDGGTPLDAEDIESVDTLFGIVTLAAAYSVGGTITLDFNYIPLANVAQAHQYDLSMSGEVKDGTDYATAASNSGVQVNKIGLIDRSLTLTRFEDIAHTFKALILNRTQVLIEIVTGSGLITFRGWFYCISQKNSGAVADLEDQSLEFRLCGRNVTNFGYVASASLNTGIAALLSNFTARTGQTVQHLPDGSTGLSGTALVAELNFSGDVQGIDEFSMKLVSGGGLSEVA